MHAKFEVNSCCGWDFRQGVNLPPPLPHAQTLHRHPMHNRVKVSSADYLNFPNLFEGTISRRCKYGTNGTYWDKISCGCSIEGFPDIKVLEKTLDSLHLNH